jgi:hypothetical protein
VYGIKSFLYMQSKTFFQEKKGHALVRVSAERKCFVMIMIPRDDWQLAASTFSPVSLLCKGFTGGLTYSTITAAQGNACHCVIRPEHVD